MATAKKPGKRTRRSFRMRTSSGYRTLDDVKDEIDVLMKVREVPMRTARQFYAAWSKVDRAIRDFEKWALVGDQLHATFKRKR